MPLSLSLSVYAVFTFYFLYLLLCIIYVIILFSFLYFSSDRTTIVYNPTQTQRHSHTNPTIGSQTRPTWTTLPYFVVYISFHFFSFLLIFFASLFCRFCPLEDRLKPTKYERCMCARCSCTLQYIIFVVYCICLYKFYSTFLRLLTSLSTAFRGEGFLKGNLLIKTFVTKTMAEKWLK